MKKNPTIFVICGDSSSQTLLNAFERASKNAGLEPIYVADDNDLAHAALRRYGDHCDGVVFIGSPSVSMEEFHNTHPSITVVALGPFPATENDVGIFATDNPTMAINHIKEEAEEHDTAHHHLGVLEANCQPALVAVAAA